MKQLTGLALTLLLSASAASAQDRFPTLQPDQMTPAQKKIADAIMAGPRKSIEGPFNAWLRSPVLADRLQKVGEYIRFDTSLPKRLNEFAILITGRFWSSQFEWYAHYPLAIKAGLSPTVAADLAAGRTPAAMQEDEAVVFAFSNELHKTKKVSDATYKSALAKFGEQGVIDLVALNGYYDVVCMTLNVAEVGLPEGVAPPLPPLAD